MKFYFVYILKCADDSYYTGVTNNIEERVKQHESGYSASSYTYNRRPVTLVFSQQMQSIQQAIELEKQIKGWSRKKKVAFINEEWDLLKMLSKSYSERKKDVSGFDPPSTLRFLRAG